MRCHSDRRSLSRTATPAVKWRGSRERPAIEEDKKMSENQIQEYSATEAALATFRQKYAQVVYAVTTPTGMRDALAARRELRECRVALETTRKRIKAPALEHCQQIDAEARRITAELVALEDPIDAQVKAEEQRRAMAEVRPGASTHALDQCARDVLREEGLEDAFCHALGHGVGLEIHEGVTLSQKRPEATLLAGEVITVEPGVYFPGRYGMRVEDMVYVS